MFSTASALLALLPVLVSTQVVPSNSTIFGGYPSNEYALEYYRASQNTNVTNAVTFAGYNWSGILGPSFPTGTTNSSEPWQLHVNYSTLEVPTSQGEVTTALTTLSMTFPDEEWSSDDWALCTSISTLPDSLTTGKSVNNSDPSCAPYLGESCVNAWVHAYRTQSTPRTGTGCPDLPSLSSIDECKSIANNFLGGVGTAAITNTTNPDLIYSYANSSYINATTGELSDYNQGNVSYQGLSSGQAFAGFFSALPSTNVAAESIDESKKVRLVGLSIVPSLAFRLNSSGGYGWESNVRLLCARPNTTSAATALSAAGSVNHIGIMSLALTVAIVVGFL